MSAANTTDETAEVPATTAMRRGRRWRVLLVGSSLMLVLLPVALSWPALQATRHLNAARRSLERGAPAAAFAPLHAAAKLQAQRAETQYLLAVAYRRVGQLEPYRAALQRAREAGWPAAEIERQEWLAVAQLGNVEQVRERLLQAIAAGVPDEGAEEIYEAMARGYLTAYRLRDAWKCLNMWLAWRPTAPQAHLMRAYIQEQLDQVPAAIEDYRAALDKLPENSAGHFKLAELLLRQGDLDEAATHFQAVSASGASPTEAETVGAWIGLARCAVGQQKVDEARRCLDAALALNPTGKPRADALAELGRLLLKEGQTDEALSNLQQAVQLAPAEIAIHRSLAAALTRAGRAEQAELHSTRAREIEARYDRVGDIQRALVEQPDNADLRCEAGQILIEQGLGTKGLGWLLTALKCNPHHRPSHQLLAEYYALAGNQELAAHHRLLAAKALASSPAPEPEAKP